MKKMMILAAALLALDLFVACADNDRPIAVTELPQTAQQFLDTHFADRKVVLAKKDSDLFDATYEVMFADGSKVEFLKNGQWKEVDCMNAPVPASVVPSRIADYVAQRYPDASVVQIDRDKRDYEVELSNRLELKFDLDFNLIDIDD